MTNESLQRAIELEPLITRAKEHIDRWENAYAYRGIGLVDCSFRGSGSYNSASMTYVPFEVVKALSLDGFRKELKKLEDEFNAL